MAITFELKTVTNWRDADFAWHGGVKEFVNYRGQEAIVHGAAETGKAQPLDATVWTPTGPRMMEDIQVGSPVLSPDGGVVTVTGVFPQGIKDVYRITLTSGDVVECTGDHLWDLRYVGGGKRNGKKPREMRVIASVTDILDNYLIGKIRKRPKYWIPQTQPVAFEYQDVPIDPYVLGILLGDGHICRGTISISTSDQEVLDEVKKRLGPSYKLRYRSGYDYAINASGFRPRRPSTGAPGYVRKHRLYDSWVVTGRLPNATGYKHIGVFKTKEEAEGALAEHAPHAFSKDDINGVGIWNEIERLGLENSRSHNKFIPESYKWNSIDVRLEVLRGLMDSDGTVDKQSGMPYFTTVSERLAFDVKEIVESLGGACIVKTKFPKGGRHLAYILTVQHNNNPYLFRLSKKKNLARVRTKYPVKRLIIGIEKVGKKPCQCIAVEGQRYLTDHFIVTHNTLGALWKLHNCALAYPGASIVIMRKTLTSTYGTVLQTFKNKVLGPDESAWPCAAYGGEKPEWFNYANGSRIWVTGMDKASRVLSAEHDILFWNQVEEATLDEWEVCTTRTTGRAGNMPYSQTIGDCNPAWPSHWMYNRDSLRMFYSRHEENPSLYDQVTGEITEQGRRTMAVLGALTGIRRTRFLEGKPAQAEGVIYDEWDEAVHLVYAAPACFRYVAGVDWGYRNPGVIGVFGIDGLSGAMYLKAQVYRTGKTDDWWLERAQELHREFGVEAFVCDPSQPAYIAKFRAAGLNAVPGFNAVMPGITAVKSRLAGGGLYVVRDSSRHEDAMLKAERKPWRVQDEFPGYVWADKRAKEQPVKENDHGIDMVRYTVAYVDGIEHKEPEEGLKSAFVWGGRR